MLNNAILSSSALAVSLVLSASAFAADPVVAIDPVPAPAVQPDSDRFCGPYAGVQAGYAWGDAEFGGQMGPMIDYYLDDGKNDGLSGGLYAGCNFRMGSWLAGVEADANLLGAGYDNNWYATLRVRGGAAVGDTLFYATGGLALGQIDMVSGNPMLAPMLDNNPYASVDTPVAVGYAVGAGVEHWFGDKVSWKTEYLYTDLGEVTSFSMSGMEYVTSDYKAHMVRTGIAIHF